MKQYLGDSVYAEVLYGDIVLTTENGYGPTATIVLESEVLDSLLRFVKKLRETPKTD
jgi:hypothetical protein